MMDENDQNLKYECTITVKMPGQSRPTSYKIAILAPNNLVAVQAAQEVWRECTEPRDIHIRVIHAATTEG